VWIPPDASRRRSLHATLMAQVLDYSAGYPGALAIARADYAGAVRYIGFPDRRKCTNRSEFEDFSRTGLGMALVYEDNADDWRGGLARGREAGLRARNHANQIGFPTNRPIYMAVDRDVVTAVEFSVMLQYLRGAAETLGGVHVTGVYGEHDVCVRAAQAGVATWFWQCRAWSGTPIRYFNGRHLFQRVGTVQVGGINCDINDITRADWGQHNAQKEAEDMAYMDDLDAAVQAFRIDAAVNLTDIAPGAPAAVRGKSVPLVGLLRQMATDIAELKTRSAADVDEAVLAAELERRGIGGATVAQVTEAVRAAFARGGQAEGGTST
jgi:hypothetical protein